MRYYLGVDGGGSKTTVLICDENKKMIKYSTGGEINYNSVGIEKARTNLKDAVCKALQGTNIVPDAAFIGLSALSSRVDEDFTRRFCGDIINCGNITMDSDVYIALEAMDVDGPVAAVICGTGSMAAGRLENGEIIHTGGWGHILGDEGSGYALSLDAVRSAIRAYEGSTGPTALTGAVLKYFNINDIESLIDIFYGSSFSRREIAGFAPVFFDCAANGDITANEILNDHVKLLSSTVCALLRKMPVSTPLGMWGGIVQNHTVFTDKLSEEIKKSFPGIKTGLLPYPPEYGAVLAAIKSDMR